jgi:hypothetical protein
MRPINLPEALLRGARLVHASGISQAISASACDSVFAGVRIARRRGRDRHVRSQRAAQAVAARACEGDRAWRRSRMCTWCLPSEDDAVILFGDASPDAVIDALHRAGARGVVLKRGAKGCVVSDGSRREQIAARARRERRRHRRRRLLRRRVRRAPHRRRRSVRGRALRQRRRGSCDYGLRRRRLRCPARATSSARLAA